uniref:Putative secreted protein n=1 Tax=Amblyomma americanum TaxID=6943 RepID=A0A0C9RX29_AMBAM
MKYAALSPLFLLMFPVAVEAGNTHPRPRNHLRCLRVCNPFARQQNCPYGCQCFPERSQANLGMCLDSNIQLPPGFGTSPTLTRQLSWHGQVRNHLRCFKVCNPYATHHRCPPGCQCFPEIMKPNMGMCLDAVLPLPPAYSRVPT